MSHSSLVVEATNNPLEEVVWSDLVVLTLLRCLQRSTLRTRCGGLKEGFCGFNESCTSAGEFARLVLQARTKNEEISDYVSATTTRRKSVIWQLSVILHVSVGSVAVDSYALLALIFDRVNSA